MVDVGTTSQHRPHQRQGLTTRIRAAHPTFDPDHPIHQLLQAQPVNQRRGSQQTRVGYQRLIIENNPHPVDILQ